MRGQWKAWEERSRAQAQSGGNIIIADLDKAPFQAAMSGLYSQFLADPKLTALVERIRQVR
jgi:hypothetical protein